jgi:hypothetical protein
VITKGSLSQVSEVNVHFPHTVSQRIEMETLQSLQEEIGERLCTLTRGKLIELCQFLQISSKDIGNSTRLSLINLLSNHLLRKELEELEDGGMAELLSVNEQLSDMIMTNVNGTEQRTELRPPEIEIKVAQRPFRQLESMTESAMYLSPEVSQSTTTRQEVTDHTLVDAPHASQRRIAPAIWHKDLKISGLIGEPGQKDRLSFSSLARQIESGLNKGYLEQDIMDSVIRAITPGLQLRSYLEGKADLTLPTLRRILRSHYQEKNATELYKQLTSEAQRAKESPQSFLIRVLDLRQKILFASQEDESGLKYDPALVQNMFLHTVLTGLQNDRIQSDLQPFLSDPTISDEVLLERLNVACSHESERQSKRKSERSAAVHVTQLNEPVHDPKHQTKQTKFDLISQLKSLSEEIMQIKETIQQPSPVSQCFTVGNKTPVTMTTIHQPLQDFSQSYQPVAEWRKELPNQTWGTSHTTHEQHQYPLQLRHPRPPQNSVPLQQHTSQSRSLQPYSISLQQPQQHPVSKQYAAQPSLYASPQFYPPQLNTAPQQFTSTIPPPQYPQQFRQSRPLRTRQCFHCQQRGPEEQCTHCYCCGSSEHFSAGCRTREARFQNRTPLNGNGLPPRDRE